MRPEPVESARSARQDRDDVPGTWDAPSSNVVTQRLVLGTAYLAKLSEAVWCSSLDVFLEAGGVWINTAFAYGSGQVEVALGRQLRRLDRKWPKSS